MRNSNPKIVKILREYPTLFQCKKGPAYKQYKQEVKK